MKIGIVTVYDGVSNIGSYLQAYAMQLALEKLGHQVYFVEKTTVPKRIWKHIARLNPKRAFFLRLASGWNYLIASRAFRFVKPERVIQELDGLLFGSDEIWNMDNPFFKDPLFFGTGYDIPKIAYAVSVGAMEQATLDQHRNITEGIHAFKKVLARDGRTQQIMGSLLEQELPLVCDPTLLVGKDALQQPVKLPQDKYILVYSYGLDQEMIDNIRRFATEKGLKIISAHFWHHFCDRTIPCTPLQFGSLMVGAEYVFTSTFHGAVFAMMNHTRCAILPVRDKVRDIAVRMGQGDRLITSDVDYDTFYRTITKDFPDEAFESILKNYREDSQMKLEEALTCLTK